MGYAINIFIAHIQRSSMNVMTTLFLSLFLVACGGEGANTSSSSGVTTDLDRPEKTSLISVSSLDADKITVDWYPSSDNSTPQEKLSYQVHISTAPDFQPTPTTLKEQTIGDLSATVEGLQADTQYYVMIVAVDEAGNESWSNELSAKTVSTSLVRTSNIVHVQTSANNPVLEDNKVTYQESADIPTVGTYITSSEGNGYLRKISSVIAQDNKVIATTEPASLNEIFEEMEFSTTVKLQTPPAQAISSRTYSAKRISTLKKAEWKTSGLTITDPNVSTKNNSLNRSNVNNNTSAKSGLSIDGDIQTNENDVIKVTGPAFLAADPGKTLKFEVKAEAWDTDASWWPGYTHIELCSIDFKGITYDGEAISILPLAKQTSYNNINDHNISMNIEWDVKQQHVTNDESPYIATFTAFADEKGDGCNGANLANTWEDEVTIEVPIYVTMGDPKLNDKKTISFSGDFTVEDRVDFTFDPEFIIDAKIRHASLQKANLLAQANISLSNTLTIESSGDGTLKQTQTLVAPKQFIKVFAAGPVPIVVRGSFGMSVEVEGNVHGAMKLEKTLKIAIPEAKFGLTYNSSGGWNPVTNFDQTYKFILEGEAEARADIKLTLIPDLQIHFYDAASGRMLVEPYLYGDLGFEGHFKYENDDGVQLNDPPDYWFTKLEAGAGIDLRLYAGLHIFDYNIASYPSNVKFSETSKYKVFHPIAKTPIYGLPKLTADIEIDRQYPTDSRAILIKGSAENLPNPFGGSSLNPFKKWTAPKTFKANASIEKWSEGESWFFYTEPGDYNVRLSGYSELGWFVRQIAPISLDLNDRDNDGITDLWERKYNIDNPVADEDGDGLTNLQEFQRGKYPRVSDNGDILTAPQNIQTTIDNQQIKITWNPVAGATKYNIRVGTLTTIIHGFDQYETQGASFTLSNLENNKTYYMVVNAENNDVEGQFSSIFNATPTNTAPQGQDRQLNPTPIATMDIPVAVSDADQDKIRVVIIEQPQHGTVSLEPSGFSATSQVILKYVSTSSTTSDSFGYYVEDEHGKKSTFYSIQLTQNIVIPSTPINLTAASGDEKLTLSWNTVGGATKYYLYESENPSFTKESTGVRRHRVTTNTLTLESLTNDQPYYLAVSAENSAGESALSAIIQATPKSTITPPTITSVAPSTSNVYSTIAQEFVVIGTNLTDTISMVLDDCSSTSLQSGGTATRRVFQCTPQSAGTKSGTVTDSGKTFNFTVNVTAKPDSASTGEISAPAEGSTHTTDTLQITLTAADTDGLQKVALLFKSGQSSYPVCEDGTATPCTGNQITKTVTVNPGDYGAEAGQVAIGLWVNDETTRPADSVDNVSITWTPPTVPAAPENIQVVSGDGKVTVSWDAVADATLYYVYESPTPDITESTSGITIHQVSATSKVIEGLNNGQTYYFAVIAENALGQGELSSIRSSTPEAGITITSVTPDTTNVYATVLQSLVVVGTNLTDNISMTLDGCPSATLQEGGTATQRIFQCVPDSTGTKSGSATDSGITFDFTVNVETKPDFASTGEITSPAEGSTHNPTDIHISLNAEDQDGIRKITLVFKENTPGYTVCEDGTARPCDGNQLSQQTHVVNPADYSAEQGQIEIGLWVTDNNGQDYHTTLVDSVTINWGGSVLTAPQNVQAVAGDGKVTLTWDTVDGATGYDICRATQTIVDPSNCYNHQGGIILLDQTSPAVITGLSNDVRYYFVVRPKNSNGNGISSIDVSAIPTGVVQPAPTGKLNDTGITQCGDYAYGTGSFNHSNSENCTDTVDAESDPIPTGQDGHSGRDADVATNDDSDGHKGFSYTKLDANGVALADQTATTFSCVKDNVTGLIWEVKTDDGGLHDKDDRYNWYNTDNSTNGGSVGFADYDGNICFGYDVSDTATYCNTQAYVARVKNTGFCGATDWRLPTREELRSIVSYDRFYPAIDTTYFPNTRSGLFWSSSPYAPSSHSAWFVAFYNGDERANLKNYNRYVRLVRSGQ